MATTQYIGARYVPMFSDPLDWDSTKAYEPLTIVYHLGNSYTSRQSVPAGIDIANTDYWAITGNYNAQIEAYRKEVQTYDGRITANAQAIADEVTRAVAEEAAIKELITAETTRAKAAESELATGVSNAITRVSEEATARENADTTLQNNIDNAKRFVKSYEDSVLVCIGDSILQGFSDESAGIDAWNVYAGSMLGYKPKNNIKSCIGGAGWTANTTASTLVTQSKDLVTNAGLKADNVTAVIFGIGVNDSMGGITADDTATGVISAVTNAKTLYPNAEIHVFPCVMGNFGYNTNTQNVIDGVERACSNLENVYMYLNTWTWNYDYPVSGGGVSKDRIHLLENGEKRVGYNMARSMIGDDRSVLSATVSVGDIAGNQFFISRNGNSMSMTVAASYGTNADGNLWAIDTRYVSLQAAGYFTDGYNTQTLVLYNNDAGLFRPFNATFSSRGLYGCMTWTIKAEWAWIGR